MHLTGMRLLLAKSAIEGWDVYADDAHMAFVNALRPESRPLWAAYPPPFQKPGHCMLVKRMLYGLHDSPLGWFECVRKHQLVQSAVDECWRPRGGPVTW